MLIIEIILTIFAWKNGWKWKALLPIGVVLILGFTIGVIVGITANNNGGVSITPPGLWLLDILAIISLIIMFIEKPKSDKTEEIK
jgi:uncharacterized membrane protein YfcA